MNESRRQALIAGLVGPHIDLYDSSATFHAQIHTLADMLEPMVEGLARSAEHHDAKLAAGVEAVKQGWTLDRQPFMEGETT